MTVGSTERDEARKVIQSTSMETAARGDRNFEVDAVSNGKSMKFTQMMSHGIKTTSTSDEKSSSIQAFLERL